jgi:hypothetical protein
MHKTKAGAKKMRLLGMDTCPSMIDIMEIRCHCINFNDRVRKVPGE